MTGVPGQGQVFTESVRAQYLADLTAGLKGHEAAARLGISRNVPAQHAKRDSLFANALTLAKKHGKAARDEGRAHGEYRYNHFACRCTTCTKDATTARAGRARSAPATRDDPEPETRTEVIHLPRPAQVVLMSSPLARVS